MGIWGVIEGLSFYGEMKEVHSLANTFDAVAVKEIDVSYHKRCSCMAGKWRGSLPRLVTLCGLREARARAAILDLLIFVKLSQNPQPCHSDYQGE